MVRDRIELPTHGASIQRSTNWAIGSKKIPNNKVRMRIEGIEPTINGIEPMYKSDL